VLHTGALGASTQARIPGALGAWEQAKKPGAFTHTGALVASALVHMVYIYRRKDPVQLHTPWHLAGIHTYRQK
jgi:hypothetical protein